MSANGTLNTVVNNRKKMITPASGQGQNTITNIDIEREGKPNTQWHCRKTKHRLDHLSWPNKYVRHKRINWGRLVISEGINNTSRLWNNMGPNQPDLGGQS